MEVISVKGKRKEKKMKKPNSPNPMKNIKRVSQKLQLVGDRIRVMSYENHKSKHPSAPTQFS